MLVTGLQPSLAAPSRVSRLPLGVPGALPLLGLGDNGAPRGLCVMAGLPWAVQADSQSDAGGLAGGVGFGRALAKPP